MKPTCPRGRTPVRALATLATCLVTISLALGCDFGGLSRDTAARLLVAGRFPAPVFTEFGILKTFLFDAKGGPATSPFADQVRVLGALEKAGLITLAVHDRTAPSFMGLLNERRQEIALTPSGLENAKLEKGMLDSWTLRARICDRVFGTVTGVSIDKARGTALVTYSWTYGNASPFLAALGESAPSHACQIGAEQSATATLRKFDDGWRVDSGG